MHINLTFWTEAKGEKVVAFGNGATMREAMTNCFAPMASIRDYPGRYLYEEVKGIGILRRVLKDGKEVARWRGIPSGERADREVEKHDLTMAPIGRDGDEENFAKMEPAPKQKPARVKLEPAPKQSKPARIKLEDGPPQQKRLRL